MFRKPKSSDDLIAPRVYRPQFFTNKLPPLQANTNTTMTTTRQGLGYSLCLLLFCLGIVTTSGFLGRMVTPLTSSNKSQLRVPTSALLQASNSCGRLQTHNIYEDHLPASRAFVYIPSDSPADTAHCQPGELLKRYGIPKHTYPAATPRFSAIQPIRTTWIYRGANKAVVLARPTIHLPVPLPPQPTPPVPVAAVVAPPPPSLEELLGTACAGATEVNIVAHQDDDLLFINPEIVQALHAGACVRTLYLTAGDAGHGRYYWQSRQRGAEAAYSVMLGIGRIWSTQSVSIAGGGVVTVAKPASSSRVSLVFFNLPDGNLDGGGFESTGHQSLTKLFAGSTGVISSVDHRATYSSSGLIQALSMLLDEYKPSRINTQSTVSVPEVADHADHFAASQIAVRAATAYESMHAPKIIPTLAYYISYPIRSMQQNLAPGDINDKSAAFFAYAAYDSDTCKTIDTCTADQSAYPAYLTRQYPTDH